VIQVDAAAAQKAGVKMMTVNDDIVISETIPYIYLSLLATRDMAWREKT
jgi:RNA:NAD 2'-phosphotransferase (TPT1/KptA family)